MKAFILCAGNGERLKPLTENNPKPLILIKGRPILSYIFSSLPDQINEVFIIIKQKHLDLFEKFLKENPIDKKFKFLFQDESIKGTYHALMSGSEFIKNENKFLVLNGDDIFLKEDLDELIKIDSPAYGLSYKILNEKYRTCDINENTKKITNFRLIKKEEKDKPVICFSGAYTLTQDFLSYKPVYVGDEAGIPHTLFGANVKVSYIILKNWYQINTIDELKSAEEDLNL